MKTYKIIFTTLDKHTQIVYVDAYNSYRAKVIFVNMYNYEEIISITKATE